LSTTFRIAERAAGRRRDRGDERQRDAEQQKAVVAADQPHRVSDIVMVWCLG
jgi:hypothetical protein